MANVRAIHSAGSSLVTYLRTNYPADLRAEIPCDFRLVSGAELGDLPNQGTVLSLMLYRVTVNEHLRNARTTDPRARPGVPLSVDLHYLMTAWAENAEWEQQILGKAMQCLESFPNLSGPMLYPTGDWSANEAVHLTIEDLGIDSLMRTFDSLALDYRLSVPYLARIVRLDGRTVEAPASTSKVVTGLTPLGATP